MNRRKLEITYRKIADLKPYKDNPRDNDKAVDAVAASIKEFGFKVPVVISKANEIVAGHTRLKAAIKLGLEEIPCVIADDLDDNQVKAYRLADNKVAELASWDMDKLLAELESIDMDMAQFGFEDLEEEMDREALEDDFDENEPLPEKPYAQRGDIFILGRHRLMCGDSTSSDDVNKLTNGNIVDMCFTDPPYNVNYGDKAETLNDYLGGERNDQHILNDSMSDEEFHDFLLKTYENAFSSLKSGGSIYVCHSETEGINFRTAFKEAGFKLSQCVIWKKNSLVMGRQDYQYIHEPILYGWKEGAGHYFVDDRTQTTVWEYPRPVKNDLHPTMKPIELVGRAITNSSKKGENVLDLFGGSGSTLIASEQLDRNAYLMELDEKYVDVIVKRYLRFVQSYENSYLIRNNEKLPLKEIPDYHVDIDSYFSYTAFWRFQLSSL